MYLTNVCCWMFADRCWLLWAIFSNAASRITDLCLGCLDYIPKFDPITEEYADVRDPDSVFFEIGMESNWTKYKAIYHSLVSPSRDDPKTNDLRGFHDMKHTSPIISTRQLKPVDRSIVILPVSTLSSENNNWHFLVILCSVMFVFVAIGLRNRFATHKGTTTTTSSVLQSTGNAIMNHISNHGQGCHTSTATQGITMASKRVVDNMAKVV